MDQVGNGIGEQSTTGHTISNEDVQLDFPKAGGSELVASRAIKETVHCDASEFIVGQPRLFFVQRSVRVKSLRICSAIPPSKKIRTGGSCIVEDQRAGEAARAVAVVAHCCHKELIPNIPIERTAAPKKVEQGLLLFSNPPTPASMS